MRLEIKPFTRERIPDVLDFEKHLREEELSTDGTSERTTSAR